MKKHSVMVFGAAALFGLTMMMTPARADDGDKKPESKPAPAEPKKPAKADKKREKRLNRFARRFGGGQLERMKDELGLSDDQVQKIKQVYADMAKDAREMFQKMREGGGQLDRQKMRQMFRERRQSVMKKVGEILTPEQQKKWRELRRSRGRRGRGGFGRRRGDPTKRLKSEALKALKMTNEEKAVLEPMIDSVLETRKLLMEQERKRKDKFLQAVRATDDEAKLKELLVKYRKERDEDKQTLKKAQAQLVEALTPVQEAKLVALNILD